MAEKSFPLRTLGTLHAFSTAMVASPPRWRLSARAGRSLSLLRSSSVGRASWSRRAAWGALGCLGLVRAVERNPGKHVTIRFALGNSRSTLPNSRSARHTLRFNTSLETRPRKRNSSTCHTTLARKATECAKARSRASWKAGEKLQTSGSRSTPPALYVGDAAERHTDPDQCTRHPRCGG
jgi:hypothetical protein